MRLGLNLLTDNLIRTLVCLRAGKWDAQHGQRSRNECVSSEITHYETPHLLGLGSPRDFLHLPRDSLYQPRDSFGFPYNSGNPKSSTCPPYALRRAAVGGNSSAATLSRCLSAAFSASSRLLDLKGEVPSSATIVADDKRFCNQIKRTRFSVRTGVGAAAVGSRESRRWRKIRRP